MLLYIRPMFYKTAPILGVWIKTQFDLFSLSHLYYSRRWFFKKIWGKVITNGTITGIVIDVSPNKDPDEFYEIEEEKEE